MTEKEKQMEIKNSFPSTIPDGWHEATDQELDPARTSLPPDTPVRINGRLSGTTLGEHLRLYLPGNYPFLLGMARGLGWEIAVPDTEDH